MRRTLVCDAARQPRSVRLGTLTHGVLSDADAALARLLDAMPPRAADDGVADGAIDASDGAASCDARVRACVDVLFAMRDAPDDDAHMHAFAYVRQSVHATA